MTAATKQWAVKIASPAAGSLAILRDGIPLPAEIGPGLTTPVEVLLVSVGTCFALSCWAAFSARGLARVAFEVSVTGYKAPQPPSHLTRIALEVAFDNSLPPAAALAVAASAEQLCTVTNTLTAKFRCQVSVDVMGLS